MATFNINPSEFKYPITFQRYTLIGKDKDGRPQYEWFKLCDTRAKVLDVRGNEFTQAYGVGLKLEKTVYIRFNHSIELTTEDRVIYRDKEFNVVYINNVSDKFLEIKLEKVT